MMTTPPPDDPHACDAGMAPPWPAASAFVDMGDDTLAPVPVKHRHDGWTHARQQDLLLALAATASVSKAARAVGMRRETAYRLRARPGPEAEQFRRAWDLALETHGLERQMDWLEVGLAEAAARAISRPMRRKGVVVGVRHGVAGPGLVLLALRRLNGVSRDRPSRRLRARLAQLRAEVADL